MELDSDAESEQQIKEYTICVIMKGNKILLKYANRGVSIGKWNFPGGKREEDETKEECVAREIKDETGLTIKGLFYNGKKDCYYGAGNILYRIHIFSSKAFDGLLKSSDEGEVKWFDRSSMPTERMWIDMKLWLDDVYNSRKIDKTIYCNKDGTVILKVVENTKKRTKATY